MALLSLSVIKTRLCVSLCILVNGSVLARVSKVESKTPWIFKRNKKGGKSFPEDTELFKQVDGSCLLSN